METMFVKSAKGKQLLLQHNYDSTHIHVLSIGPKVVNDVFEVPFTSFMRSYVNPQNVLVEVQAPAKYHKMKNGFEKGKDDNYSYVDETKDEKLRAQTEREERKAERRAKAEREVKRGRKPISEAAE